MRKLVTVVMGFLSVAVAAYAVVGYTAAPMGALVHPDMGPGFRTHAVGVYTHVFAAAFALLLGPLQFSARLRRARPALHRLSGGLYLGFGVLLGGLAGLYLAQFAHGGPVARLGFGTLAVCWLYTGLQAYLAIRRRDVRSHQRWMMRNFALAFAAVMLRVYIPLSFVVGLDFERAYALIAWLCWVPNLVVAESIGLAPTDKRRTDGAPRGSLTS